MLFPFFFSLFRPYRVIALSLPPSQQFRRFLDFIVWRPHAAPDNPRALRLGRLRGEEDGEQIIYIKHAPILPGKKRAAQSFRERRIYRLGVLS